MKKYLAALLVAVGMLLVMAVPALAQEVGCVEEFPGTGSGACEQNPGGSEGSRSLHQTPPEDKHGAISRSGEANEHDTNTDTGRGKRLEVIEV